MANPDYVGRVSVRRIRINRGGYARDGYYFGVGAPVYVMEDEEGSQSYLRASDREDAIRRVRTTLPNARIRR